MSNKIETKEELRRDFEMYESNAKFDVDTSYLDEYRCVLERVEAGQLTVADALVELEEEARG